MTDIHTVLLAVLFVHSLAVTKQVINHVSNGQRMAALANACFMVEVYNIKGVKRINPSRLSSC